VQPEVGPSIVVVAAQEAGSARTGKARTRARVRQGDALAQTTRRLMGMDMRPRSVAFYGE